MFFGKGISLQRRRRANATKLASVLLQTRLFDRDAMAEEELAPPCLLPGAKRPALLTASALGVDCDSG